MSLTPASTLGSSSLSRPFKDGRLLPSVVRPRWLHVIFARVGGKGKRMICLRFRNFQWDDEKYLVFLLGQGELFRSEGLYDFGKARVRVQNQKPEEFRLVSMCCGRHHDSFGINYMIILVSYKLCYVIRKRFTSQSTGHIRMISYLQVKLMCLELPAKKQLPWEW
jgi:hypothetical protein